MKTTIVFALLFYALPAFADWQATDEELVEIYAVDQAALFIEEREREAKILQSIEPLDKTLDLLEMDRLQRLDRNEFNEQELDSEIFEERSLLNRQMRHGELDTNLEEENFTDEEFIDEGFDDEGFGDDGFEFLDAEIELLNQDLKQNKNATDKTKRQDKKSVGIKGKEEALINKLDNSDLMDFEKDIEIWGKDIKVFDDDDGTKGNE